MLKVFIADDLYFFRQALKQDIDWASLDMEICGEAENGEAADIAIKNLKPDIALLDINMPVKDGLTLAKEIGEHNLNTKVIILTGYGEFDYARKALIFGARNYVLKPVDSNELVEALIKVKDEIEDERRMEKLQKIPFIENPKHRYVQAARQFINENVHNPKLNLTLIANFCYVNPSYLSSIFKRETGKTVHEYITEQRMYKAADMLSSGQYSLAQVSDAVGFVDVCYFGKCFKKMFGVTPGGYDVSK